MHTMAEERKIKRRKKQAERKTDMLRVRVTVEQKRLFEDAAKATGLDVSGWLRMLGIREATKEKAVSDEE